MCTNCINIDVKVSELAFSQTELLTRGTVYLSLSYLPACQLCVVCLSVCLSVCDASVLGQDD